MPQLLILGLSFSKAPLQASTSSSWARSGKPSRTRYSSSFHEPRRIFTLPARHCELNGPNRVILSPLSGAVLTVKPLSARQVKCLALTGLPRILTEPDAYPCAVLRGGIAPYVGVLLFAHYVSSWPWAQAQIAGIALSTTSVAVVYAVMVETGFDETEIGRLF